MLYQQHAGANWATRSPPRTARTTAHSPASGILPSGKARALLVGMNKTGRIFLGGWMANTNFIYRTGSNSCSLGNPASPKTTRSNSESRPSTPSSPYVPGEIQTGLWVGCRSRRPKGSRMGGSLRMTSRLAFRLLKSAPPLRAALRIDAQRGGFDATASHAITQETRHSGLIQSGIRRACSLGHEWDRVVQHGD